MTINKIFPATATKKEVYGLTKGQSKQSKDFAHGEVVTPVQWCEYEEVNGKGEDVTVLSMRLSTGEYLSVISPTFRGEFNDVVELMQIDENTCEEFDLVILHGVTKSDKAYVTCRMAT